MGDHDIMDQVLAAVLHAASRSQNNTDIFFQLLEKKHPQLAFVDAHAGGVKAAVRDVADFVRDLKTFFQVLPQQSKKSTLRQVFTQLRNHASPSSQGFSHVQVNIVEFTAIFDQANLVKALQHLFCFLARWGRAKQIDRFILRSSVNPDGLSLSLALSHPSFNADFALHWFEPFFNKPQARMKDMDLPLCRKYIQTAGGQISIDDLVEGKVLTIRIPLDELQCSDPVVYFQEQYAL